MIKLFVFLVGICFLASPVLAADAWVCPMHCEGAKTYDHPGKCPVCGMKLEKAGEAPAPLNTRDYRVDQLLDPKPLRAGEPASITLTPRHTKDGSPVKELASPLQATMVADDQSALERLKLQKLPDGAFRAPVKPFSGKFTLFVEFTPAGGPRQVFPLAMSAEGEGKSAAPKQNPLKADAAKSTGKVSVAAVRDCLLINEEETYFERIALKDMHCEAHPRPGLYRLWYETRKGQATADLHIH